VLASADGGRPASRVRGAVNLHHDKHWRRPIQAIVLVCAIERRHYEHDLHGMR